MKTKSQKSLKACLTTTFKMNKITSLAVIAAVLGLCLATYGPAHKSGSGGSRHGMSGNGMSEGNMDAGNDGRGGSDDRNRGGHGGFMGGDDNGRGGRGDDNGRTGESKTINIGIQSVSVPVVRVPSVRVPLVHVQIVPRIRIPQVIIPRSQVPKVIVTFRGQWSVWGPYTVCSKRCGGGSQTRTRSCSRPASDVGRYIGCDGQSSQTRSCNPHSCAVDGMWGQWGQFSACSLQCGGGVRSRSRSCDSPSPANGGKNCVGLPADSLSCNTHPCVVKSAVLADRY